MGIYLSQPNKNKDYSFGEDKQRSLRYFSCGIQGWRKNMEDAHITQVDLTERYSLFGVFDGHGGFEVAKFCEVYFADVLKK